MPDYRFGPSTCPPDNSEWWEKYEQSAGALESELELFRRMSRMVPGSLVRHYRIHQLKIQADNVRAALDDLLKVCAE